LKHFAAADTDNASLTSTHIMYNLVFLYHA